MESLKASNLFTLMSTVYEISVAHCLRVPFGSLWWSPATGSVSVSSSGVYRVGFCTQGREAETQGAEQVPGSQPPGTAMAQQVQEPWLSIHRAPISHRDDHSGLAGAGLLGFVRNGRGSAGAPAVNGISRWEEQTLFLQLSMCKRER